MKRRGFFGSLAAVLLAPFVQAWLVKAQIDYNQNRWIYRWREMGVGFTVDASELRDIDRTSLSWWRNTKPPLPDPAERERLIRRLFDDL